jgi:predicted phosphodiesterase
MRVAALYDIHGNLPALQAVLQEIRQDQGKLDRIVVGGDVLPGPMPRETLTQLLQLDVPVGFIQGNGEVAALAEVAGRNSGVPERFRGAVRWSGEQLDPEQRRFLTTWPKTFHLHLPGMGDVLFCHATPRNENEIFTRLTPEQRLVPVFADVDAFAVVCGHTHMQFDRMVGSVRVVNAGSVGMPFGEPGAYWLLLDENIQLRRTVFDLELAAKRIRASNYPQAQDFAENNVLQPPSEEKMLQLFAGAELK